MSKEIVAASLIFRSAAEDGTGFVEITKDASDDIVIQLVGKDRVHTLGAGSIEELRRHRLGGPGFDRTAFAMVSRDGKAGSLTVDAVIYVFKGVKPVHDFLDLKGNVRKILEGESSTLLGKPTSMTFYSISNITNKSGVGQRLVMNLHSHLTLFYPNAQLTTLSPLRTFDDNRHPTFREEFLSMDEVAQKRMVIEYLLTSADPVQIFHMGNGARIADVKLSAGDISGEGIDAIGHLAMVNYGYTRNPEVLSQNAQMFRLVKNALRNEGMDPQKKAEIVRAVVYAQLSPELLKSAGMASFEEVYGFKTTFADMALKM